MKKFTTAVLLLLLLSSCTDNTIYNRFRHIHGDGWSRFDTLTFNPPEVQENGLYTCRMHIRTRTDFPYSTIWICREYRSHRDTIRLDLSHDKAHLDGKGLDILSFDFPAPPIRLLCRRHDSIRIYHLMQTPEEIPGIHEIGIKLSRR